MSLLTVMQQRFGVTIDPDSDAGQILGALTPRPPFNDNSSTGQADITPLTFMLTPQGVSVRAAQATDALIFSVPQGPLDFALFPADAEHPTPTVEITLVTPIVPVPPLHPAQPDGPDHVVPAGGGDVSLRLPSVLLVVSAGPPASVRLAPAAGAGGGLTVSMQPPFALLDSEGVFGFGLAQATLFLEGPTAPAIIAPDVTLFIAPPGMPALALRAAAHDLRIGLAAGAGISGDFTLNLAADASPDRPAWLSLLNVQARLTHSVVTRLSLSGQIDLQTAVETKLGGSLNEPAATAIDYTLSLAFDAGWQASLALSAAAGSSALWRTQRASQADDNPLRDTLGAFAVFAPLLAPNPPEAGADGLTDLALGAGAAASVTASGLVKTQAVTLYGGELILRRAADGKLRGILLFDIETELTLSTGPAGSPLLQTRTPIKVRHQALGLQLDFSGGNLRPVFDRGRGFDLDLSDPGLFTLPGSLGNIIQPQGARMARDNPLNFEVDLTLKAELGVVTVDRATVRIPIDTVALPSLSALGASVEIPGALSGHGYLQITPTGLAGSLDASLPTLGVRVAAGLAVDDLPNGPIAILATLGVELPVPIPLANSGLGLFGFLGLFGMHYRRKPARTALAWLVETADGDATRLSAWEAQEDHWALGIGAVLGTLEGGFLIHAKGMVVIEAPAPKVLLVMNADLLSVRPETIGKETGAFLAVIEISPQSITIGLMLEYGIKPLFEVRVPVEAFYRLGSTDDWHLDVGGLAPKPPAAVRFLFSFDAEGYFLLHGNGIPSPGEVVDPGAFPIGPLQGFSVAAGIRAALTWGVEATGLYLRVAAQADVGISFSPFLIVGHMQLRGELHLFITGLEVSAEADVTITPDQFYVHAEVCGKVEFFLFEVKGCVELELGAEPARPSADPLLRAVSLHSRAPALLTGTGDDRAIDGSLGDARQVGEAGELPTVPIDTIPVLQFEMAPVVDPNCRVLGEPLAPKLDPTSWTRRGSRYYRYTLHTVELTGFAPDGSVRPSPVTDGDKPSTWWDRHLLPTGGDDNEVQLALLNWLPEATPAAAERTQERNEYIHQRWGSLCVPIAPPTNVLWDVLGANLGSAPSGWTLFGTAWPDPPGTSRSRPPQIRLRVTEPWRSHPLLDGLSAVRPAVVLGSNRVAERVLVAPRTGLERRPLIEDNQLQALIDALQPPAWETLADSLKLDTQGMTFIRVMLALPEEVHAGGLLKLRALDADGNDLGFQLSFEPSQAIQAFTPNDLPDPWRDPAGPWAAPIANAWNGWRRLCVDLTHEAPFIVLETPLPDGTASVVIGTDVDVDIPAPYWALVLAEVTTLAEFARHGQDEASRRTSVATINGALNADQGQRALLLPNTEYHLKITYTVEIFNLDDEKKIVPELDQNGDPRVESGDQEFRFRTDATAPRRLAPWILTTDPAPYEEFFFWGDPLHVVFSTNATRKLYATYGRELFAVVKAASGKHPPAAPNFDPARVALGQTVALPRSLPAEAVTPWESALHDLLPDLDCLVKPGAVNRHETHTLTLQLEPRTAYVLDLETDRPADGSLYRLHFSTSRYASMAALAGDLHGAPVHHRYLPSIAPLSALGAAQPGQRHVIVRDLDLEQALRAVRWGDLAQPDGSGATVIWGDGPQPQPTAILLETPEPLWRWRPAPQKVKDQAGTQRYQLVSQRWLDVEEGANGGLVTQFILTQGGGRALVLLRPPARGHTLHLDLRRHFHRQIEDNTKVQLASLLDVTLAMAPWEATS